MRISPTRKAFVLLGCLSFAASGTLDPSNQNSLSLKVLNAFEVGQDSDTGLFASIAAVCEDREGCFYVLDRMERKVHRFSTGGKLLSSFGQKGQGPGDFDRPNRIGLTSEGKLFVAEDVYSISFLETDGTFITRVKLDGRLAPGYIGTDRYYGWIWREDDRQQVLTDRDNSVIQTFNTVPRDLFSVSAPDSSGRSVMFNYGPEEYAPSLLFTYGIGYSVIAVGNVYNIPLLDPEGNIVIRIRRNIPAEPLSRQEKRFFAKDIEVTGTKRDWPKRVIQDLTDKIPSRKNYFDHILVSNRNVFVFRIRTDITQTEEDIPVDVFDLSGLHLGTVGIVDKPIHVSGTRMYFRKTDPTENVYLQVSEYSLSFR